MSTTCIACQALAPMGIRCNAHRTESTGSRLIREAIAAGHVLTGTPAEQAIQAERLLGRRGIVVR